MFDIAIVGGGFSGAMVAVNLVRGATKPFSLIIFEPAPEIGVGVAYSTPSPLHLLNVRAAKMGAFPDREKHFFEWLQTTEAKTLAAKYRLPEWKEEDFVPRLLYGAYIKHLWRDMLQHAAAKKITIEAHHENVTAIRPEKEHFRLTAGRAFNASHLVLATGNQFAGPAAPGQRIVTNVFHYDYVALCKEEHTLPALIIGTGLTAVDTFLSLRAAGWKQKIILLSRRALLPAVHELYQPYPKPLQQRRLLALMRELRHAAAAWQGEGGSWQAVVDSLRPKLQEIWKGFSVRERDIFFRRLFTYWNIHRHRMAPEIGHPLHDSIRKGEVLLRHGGLRSLREKTDAVQAEYMHRGEMKTLDAAVAFQCIGPDYRSIVKAPMVETLIKEKYLTASPIGLGVLADKRLKAYADEKKSIHVMGNYLLGELLETTAVPELRGEAQIISSSLEKILA